MTGRLVREEGQFMLACHDGRKLRLVLRRTPVDLVEKAVTVTGVMTGDVLDADGAAPLVG
ncbi:hypothetical protein KCG44_11645 [Pacificimonas sp. WHA3]|uniref:Uncharacterized protein n=1 Tax=Pacificimonas pallii TaxID=2827236 RepID=A0ABS6SG97_9SPHN|nr:hypothetical protein [Pacificimonas pallii]